MFRFINLTSQTPPGVIHGWKATDLLYEIVRTKKYFFGHVKRQIFDDAPKQTFYMISKLVVRTFLWGWPCVHKSSTCFVFAASSVQQDKVFFLSGVDLCRRHHQTGSRRHCQCVQQLNHGWCRMHYGWWSFLQKKLIIFFRRWWRGWSYSQSSWTSSESWELHSEWVTTTSPLSQTDTVNFFVTLIDRLTESVRSKTQLQILILNLWSNTMPMQTFDNAWHFHSSQCWLLGARTARPKSAVATDCLQDMSSPLLARTSLIDVFASFSKQVLENAYLNSLKVMKENNLRSIAFPCISTGIYGYPHVSLFCYSEKAGAIELLGVRLYRCPAHGQILPGAEQGFCWQGFYSP